jgi:RNA polymerase sigma factor (TIGR02999 family)
MAVTRAPTPQPGEVTTLLQAWSEGNAAARDRLMPYVYAELRRRAAGQLRRERRGHTLRPTDLVHETYMRLCEQNPAWQNREQFFAVASKLMRRILVDHARQRGAAKRGRGLRVTLDEGAAAANPVTPDLLDLDAALDELSQLDERKRAWSSCASSAASRSRRPRARSACRWLQRTAIGRWRRPGSTGG